MSTVQQAINDKKEMDVEIMRLICDYQRKHPGLIIDGISITITKVNGYPPVQSIESVVRIT